MKQTQDPSTISRERRFSALRRIGVVVAAAACVAAWAIGARQLGADLLSAQAESLTREKERLEAEKQALPDGVDVEALAQGLTARAVGLTARAVELNPYHAVALVARARDLFVAERLPEALEAAQRANRLLTTPETLNQIGSILLRLAERSLQSGDKSRAREFRTQAGDAFMETLAIAPSNREALERLVSIAQIDRDAGRMLDRLRRLSGSCFFLPNTAYFWAQFWKEIAQATKSPLYYAAGRRASGLAHNRPVPPDYSLFYDVKDMMMHHNYFMMGARGMNVPDTGEIFQPKRPVDIVHVGLRF